MVFAGIEEEGCVPNPDSGPAADNYVQTDSFSLQMAGDPSGAHPVVSQEKRADEVLGGTSADAGETADGILAQRLTGEDANFLPAPGGCDTGWVTFAVPDGSRPVAVVYRGARGSTLRWALP